MNKDDMPVDELRNLRDNLARVCGEDEHNLGVVMTALTALLIETGLEQAELDPAEFIARIVKNVMNYVKVMEATDEEVDEMEKVVDALNEKGEIQWLN